ncbi:MAG: YcnI family protein [Patescibacteria group bacterium]
MKIRNQKIQMFAVALGVLAFTFANTASAHVVVKPAEVVTAGFLTFTAGVPNERETAVTKIKVAIPDGLNYVTPTQKAGWTISVEEEGTGESAVVKAITWDGGTINAGFRDEFTFSAQVPEKATELQWKAYQTYADGTVVAWDKAGDAEKSDISGPFSVTKVVSETEDAKSVKAADQSAKDAKGTADTALYVGLAGVIAGIAGIFLATRKKS